MQISRITFVTWQIFVCLRMYTIVTTTLGGTTTDTIYDIALYSTHKVVRLSSS